MPSSNNHDDIDRLLNKGLDYYGKDFHSEAIKVWKQVLDIDPGNDTARDYLESAGVEVGPGAEEVIAAVGSASEAESASVDNFEKRFLDTCSSLELDASVSPEALAEKKRLCETEAATPPAGEDAPSGDEAEINFELIDGGSFAATEEACRPEVKISREDILKLIQAKDYERAQTVLSCALEQNKDDEVLKRSLALVENHLTLKYANMVGGMDKIPKLIRMLDELKDMDLNPEVGYLASLIDGMISLEEIVSISGLGVFKTYRYILDLLSDKIIDLK